MPKENINFHLKLIFKTKFLTPLLPDAFFRNNPANAPITVIIISNIKFIILIVTASNGEIGD